MDREQAMPVLAMFLPDVRQTLGCNNFLVCFLSFFVFTIIIDIIITLFLKLNHVAVKEFVADEYLGTSGDRLKVRDGFTELLGDIMFTIPAIKTANYHRGNCELK